MAHVTRIRPISTAESKRLNCVVISDNVGSAHVVRVVGEADLSSAPQIDAALQAAARLSQSIILDFSACRYFDSTVIRVLVRGMKQWSDRFAIVVPEDSPLRRILAICDLEGILPIAPSVFAARARTRA